MQCVYSMSKIGVCFSEELRPIASVLIYTSSEQLVTWELNILLLFDWWPSSCQNKCGDCSLILTATFKDAIHLVL